LFPRPAGYSITEYESANSAAVMHLADGELPLAGRVTEIRYATKRARPSGSPVLMRRFLDAVGRAGGEVVFSENPALGGLRAVGRLPRDGRDVWVEQEVTPPRGYKLTIVDVPAMRVPRIPRPVPPESEYEAEALSLDMLRIVERDGGIDFHVTFARGSDRLGPGYEADFKKFAMMMKKDPSMRFRIETFTDTDRKPSAQRTLMRDRISALYSALVSLGADGKRLTKIPSSEATAPVPRGLARLVLLPRDAAFEPGDGDGDVNTKEELSQ
jgi:hypothetical protein